MKALISPFAARAVPALLLPLLFQVAPGCARSSAETARSSAEATKGGAPGEAAPISVKTATVHEVKIPRVLTLSGTLTGAEQAQVAAGAAGKVLATYVERGSVVRKGSPLVKLDARIISAQADEASAQVESLKLQRAQAELDCERTQKMFDKGAISHSEYDRQRTQCQTAKWTLAGAEARRAQTTEAVRDTEIRAPFSGMVVERAVSAGEYVRADSRVATLVGVSSLRLELTVPEADVALVKQGMSVDFRVASKRGGIYHGRIRYVGPSVRQQTRDAVVEAIVENPAHELRPGMFVTAEMALGEQNLPAVPQTAVQVDGALRRVFVVVNGRLEERLVQVAEARGAEVPIVAGVKSGDQVVAIVTPEVRDGARIK